MLGVADVAVRTARPGDVPEIARIQVETWRTAYKRFLPESVLAALDEGAAEAAWGEAVAAPPTPAHHVLVATEGPTTVGFAAVSPSAEEGAPADSAEIAVLLVEPRWGRRGHGSRLLAAIVDHLRQDGAIRLVTWVPDGDTATTAFYASANWERDGGTRILEADGGTVREGRWHVEIGE